MTIIMCVCVAIAGLLLDLRGVQVCLWLWTSVCTSFSRTMDTVEPAPSTVPGEKGGGDGEKSSAVATPTTGKEPLLGTHYQVCRVDNSSHVGEVIQRRSNFENGFIEYCTN